MTKQLPSPPLPPTVDLRGLSYMPLDVVRLRDSEIVLKTEPEEFRCAVLLWCSSWHQVPAASLPDDDRTLADLAGFGRAVREWQRVKAGALRGFVKCDDGRLYHAVVAEKAITAWIGRLKQRHETECAKIAKRNQRHDPKDKEPMPNFEQWIEREAPEAKPFLSMRTTGNVQQDSPSGQAGVSTETHANVHRDNGQSPPGQGPLSSTKRHPREVKGSEVPVPTALPVIDTSGPSDRTAEAADAQSPPPAEILNRIMRELRNGKVNVDPESDTPIVQRWIREGTTPGQVLIAVTEARKPGCKPYPQPLPIGYVDTILKRIVDADREERTKREERLAQQGRDREAAREAAARSTAPPDELMAPFRKPAVPAQELISEDVESKPKAAARPPEFPSLKLGKA